MPRRAETQADLEALAHHLDAASSYAEQLGLTDLRKRIDANSNELRDLRESRGLDGYPRPPPDAEPF